MEPTRQEPETVVDKPKPPPMPFRANTTGLSTQNLPSPPVRRVGEDGQISGTTAINSVLAPKPNLPPRLPPRQSSNQTRNSPSPPPPYSPAVPAPGSTWQAGSQGTANRLGAAGISVPGLGIRRSDSATAASPDQPNTQMTELQSRFGRMTTQSAPTETPSQGTSFADKQAAFQTAQSFRQDPSSVSLADARTAASTADNFRQRHGDQVASGWKSANALNKEYNVSGRVNSHMGGDSTLGEAASGDSGIMSRKSAPPPPPKRITAGDGSSAASPPPIPFSSKPKS